MYSQYILAQVGLLIWHASFSFSLPPTTYRGICYSQLLLHNLMYAVGIPILRFWSLFVDGADPIFGVTAKQRNTSYFSFVSFWFSGI